MSLHHATAPPAPTARPPEMAAFHPWAGDQTAALDALLSRRSVSVRLLSDPAPSAAALEIMIRTALRAPDHGTLRPWRFICVQGPARAALGDVFASARARREPTASADDLDRERRKPLRAPLVIGLGAVVTASHPSVRAIDQQLAAGAAAMNLLNAAHILGFGGMWLTGASCHDPNVKQAVGLAATDFLAGWLYVGTPVAAPAPVDRLHPSMAMTRWGDVA